ncbi:KPTN protein, partial [Bucco capensis]|nr:KPTN protein [Bucco capensis]
CPLVEDSFSRLASQSNVYGLAALQGGEGPGGLLAAALKGKVIYFRYQELRERLRPVARELQFTYIPGVPERGRGHRKLPGGGPEHPGKGLGVLLGRSGVLLKGSEAPCGGLGDPGRALGLLGGSQGLLKVSVPILTLVLSAVAVPIPFPFPIPSCVFPWQHLGSHQFEEQPLAQLFPELLDLPSNVLWLDVCNIPGSGCRISAFGCHNGYIRVSHVQQSPGPVVLQSWSLQQDGPISKVLVFPWQQEGEGRGKSTGSPGSPVPSSGTAPAYSVLVTSTIEPTVLYRDVLQQGLSCQLLLPGTEQLDSVLCALVTDIDLDGNREILLGTYGQDLLCYKFSTPSSTAPAPAAQDSWPALTSSPGVPSSSSSSPGGIPCSPGVLPVQLELCWHRRFPSPLLSLLQVDLTADGLQELAVVCLRGLHVLQHSLEPVARCLLQRLRRELQRRARLQGL